MSACRIFKFETNHTIYFILFARKNPPLQWSLVVAAPILRKRRVRIWFRRPITYLLTLLAFHLFFGVARLDKGRLEHAPRSIRPPLTDPFSGLYQLLVAEGGARGDGGEGEKMGFTQIIDKRRWRYIVMYRLFTKRPTSDSDEEVPIAVRLDGSLVVPLLWSFPLSVSTTSPSSITAACLKLRCIGLLQANADSL